MAENSKIEWTDHTFNPWVGCTKVSPACDHCYAENWAKRTGQPHLWAGERRRTSESNWQQPYRWNRKAEAEGRRYRVFCASLADVFDNKAQTRWRDDLWFMIDQTPHLDWLLLTKRPQMIERFLPDVRTGVKPWGEGWPNVWLGTTVENQEEAERRIPHLARVPAKVRFLSCEPLLTELDLDYPETMFPGGPARCCSGHECGCQGRPVDPPLIWGIHWVIGGGESGPGWRPTPQDAFDKLMVDCAANRVAFFMKQMPNKAPIPHHLMVRQFPSIAP